MAHIPALPALDIIDGLRGTIDYYCYMDRICVRKWPRSPGRRRSTAVESQWPAFRYAAQQSSSLSATVVQAFRSMAAGSRLTWKDLYTRSYIKGLTFD